MLTLTSEAATAIHDLIDEGELPEESALRISSRASENGAPAFALTLEATPHPQDQVVEADGARVFVDPAVAPALDDKALDVHVTNGGGVEFVLASQT